MKNSRLSFFYFVLLLSVALLISCGGGSGSSPSAWSKTFGGSTGSGNAVRQTTPDGGYILLGEINSVGSSGFDAYLVKTDQQGVMTWSTTIGGSGNEEMSDIQQTADGGYVLIGTTASFGVENTNVYLVKTDPTGTVEWSRTYGGADHDYGVSVQQTPDGFLLFGTVLSSGSGTSDMYLIKTTSTGTMVWSNTYGEPDWKNEGSSVLQTSDGYILLGTTRSDTTNNSVMNLIKTDTTGSVLWSKKYSAPDSDARSYALGKAADNGFILCGQAYTGVYDYLGIYLVKTDANGKEEWNKLLTKGDYNYAYSVQETADHGFVVAGYTYSNATEYPYSTPAALYLAKVDSGGNLLWSRTYQGASAAIAHSIQETTDGGFIVLGQTSSNPWDASMWRMFLLKTDSNGQ